MNIYKPLSILKKMNLLLNQRYHHFILWNIIQPKTYIEYFLINIYNPICLLKKVNLLLNQRYLLFRVFLMYLYPTKTDI